MNISERTDAEQGSANVSIVGAWSIVGTLLSGGDPNRPFLWVAIFTADGCMAMSSTFYTQSAGTWRSLSPTSIQFSLVEPMIGGGAWIGDFYDYAAEVNISSDGLSFSMPASIPMQTVLRGPDGKIITPMSIILTGTRIQVGPPDTLPRQIQ
jgi:hypothetical protein